MVKVDGLWFKRTESGLSTFEDRSLFGVLSRLLSLKAVHFSSSGPSFFVISNSGLNSVKYSG